MDQTETLNTQLGQLADANVNREQVNEQLAAFAQHLELPGLQLDDDGMAFLELEDEYEVVLLHLPGSPGVIVSAPVGNAETAATDLLQHLLQSNMDFELTRGGALGVDPGGRHLMFSRLLILAGRSPGQMEADLADIAGIAQTWRNEILAYIGADDEPQPLQPPPETGFIRV
jgi:hypothetical protein